MKKSTNTGDPDLRGRSKVLAATDDPRRVRLSSRFHERCIFAAKLRRLVSQDKMYTGEIALRRSYRMTWKRAQRREMKFGFRVIEKIRDREYHRSGRVTLGRKLPKNPLGRNPRRNRRLYLRAWPGPNSIFSYSNSSSPLRSPFLFLTVQFLHPASPDTTWSRERTVSFL